MMRVCVFVFVYVSAARISSSTTKNAS